MVKTRCSSQCKLSCQDHGIHCRGSYVCISNGGLANFTQSVTLILKLNWYKCAIQGMNFMLGETDMLCRKALAHLGLLPQFPVILFNKDKINFVK